MDCLGGIKTSCISENKYILVVETSTRVNVIWGESRLLLKQQLRDIAAVSNVREWAFYKLDGASKRQLF